ncbi:Ig-like domain-containing protein [Melittangium boletus]|uniref:BIG2 domain-containing protein n=1 Tax=Melittangium boletus DSM 14713 TaxID=1294270 RepID=A0A250ISU0_9BACT|nr:Ig-like domain-containing protein [Melittangium boletus]ATB34006.1 hypothetical protein MEBOL_007507 [Melittangium boletus DSM 14713]
MKSNNAFSWLTTVLLLGGCAPSPVSQPPAEEPPRLEEVRVTCAPTALVLGQSAQCSASARDQKGQPFAISSYTWTSSDSALAQVDASGKVVAHAPGSVSIRASATSGDSTRQGEASLSLSPRPPTVHSTSISASETWTLADSPHEVRGQLSITDGATLSLQPGVVVLFAPDAELRVAQGALLAPGSSAQPISLVAPDSSAQGAWRGLVFASEGSASRLEHVSLRGCGQSTGEGACLVLRDKASPILLDVSVDKSGSLGVSVADDGSSFGPDSARLSVSGSSGFALRLASNHADSLPPNSTFSGNGRDAVLLAGDVTRSLSWPNPGVPFVILQRIHVELPVDNLIATLTLTPGTTLRFGPEGELALGGGTYLGDLVSEGTADAPILFTSDSASPQPGQWRGLHLGPYITPATRLVHTTVEYAGASGSPRGGTANLNLYGDSGFCGPCPVLQDVTLRKGSGLGLLLNEFARFDPSSTRLTVRDNGGYALSMDSNEVRSLPSQSTYSGNATEGVLLKGFVADSQSWPKLDVPYVIDEVLQVGYLYAPNPVLTLAPGTELRFNLDAEILIGPDVDSPGVLIAKGTAAEPIRFVANDPAPLRGFWRGIHIWWGEGSQFDHVFMSHAGANGRRATASINVYRNPAPSITNGQFNWTGGCALMTSNKDSGNNQSVPMDYTLPEYNNSFTNNSINNQCSY